MNPVSIFEGASPVILGQPHGGIFIPDDIRKSLNDTGKAISDTDWHITRLYDGLIEGATIVTANFHRYVIDANRDPSGQSLYPGQNTTGLCPLTDFDGLKIYHEGAEPDPDEVEDRRKIYHGFYHAALAAQIARTRELHGVAILYDCHSIRSDIPFLFDGQLPVFNIGTNDGATCAPEIEKIVADTCHEADGFEAVVNGRFRGGWTTRHYGKPATGVHTIQMELAQRTYMDEKPPWNYRKDLAGQLRPHLAKLLQGLNDYACEMAESV